MEGPSVQERFAPHNACFGCGPSNPKGLRIRSFEEGDHLVARWRAEEHHQAFPGVLNGGIVGALLDCHSNWAATVALMRAQGLESPPCTVTSDFAVTLKRPTPMDAGDLALGEGRGGRGGPRDGRGDAERGGEGDRHLPRDLRGGEAGASRVPPLVSGARLREGEPDETAPISRASRRGRSGWRSRARAALGRRRGGHASRAPRRPWMAGRGGVEGALRTGAGPAAPGRFAAGEGRSGPGQADAEPVLHRRPGLGNPEHGMGGRVDLEPERLRSRREERRGRLGGGGLRPRAPAPAGGQGRWTQLPRGVQRTRLAPRLDPGDGGRHLAGRLRPARVRGQVPAGTGGERGGGRALVSRLRRSDHAGWPVRAGRRMRHGGSRRAGAGRRVRELLQAVRHGCGEPARGRGGDRGRSRPAGERLHAPGPLLGAEGRRRPELRRRHPADAADPRTAGDVRWSVADSRGGLRCSVQAADPPLRRLLRCVPHESALGGASQTARPQPDGSPDDLPGPGHRAGGGDLEAVPLRGDEAGERGPGRLRPDHPQCAGA